MTLRGSNMVTSGKVVGLVWFLPSHKQTSELKYLDKPCR